MKIRSITYFCNPKYPLEESVLRKAGRFLSEAKSAYEAAGYEVQTVRLATVPFPRLLGEANLTRLPELTSQMDRITQQLGIGYFSLGPALPEVPHSYEIIPDAIFMSKNAFLGGVMADTAGELDLAAIQACAEIIVRCSTLEPNGFANLQFAALANVRAGAPFLPAAYHEGDTPAFAIATEAADLAVQAFELVKSIEEGRGNLILEIEKHGKKLARIAKSLDCKFGGIDFSLAPFPDDAHSLGNAVEKMGVPRIGLHGSLAAAAILTEAIDRAYFPHTGFSGFMQPVLEELDPGETGCRRNADHQGCSALFGRLRDRAGHGSPAGRYNGRTACSPAVGCMRPGSASRQAIDRPSHAGTWEAGR